MKIQLLIPTLILLVTLSLPVTANGDFEGSHPETYPSPGFSHEGHESISEGWSSEDHPYTEEGYSDYYDEDFDEEDFDMEEDIATILEIIREIEEVYMQMRAEIEEYHNRSLDKVVNKLDDCVDIFNETMGETEEEFPTTCEEGITWGLKVFSKAISLLEKRRCDDVNITRRCIPQEIADKYIPQLKELYEELEEEVLWDEDEDGTPDICKYWEEWEDDEEHSPPSEEH